MKIKILKFLGTKPTYDPNPPKFLIQVSDSKRDRDGVVLGSLVPFDLLSKWWIMIGMTLSASTCTLHWPSRFGLEQYRSSEARKSFLLEDIPWGKTRPIVARIEIGCPRMIIFNFQNCMLTHIEHLEIKSYDYIGCTGLEHWTLMKMIKAMVLVRSELNCWFFHGASRKMITFLRIVQLDHQEKPPTHFEG